MIAADSPPVERAAKPDTARRRWHFGILVTVALVLAAFISRRPDQWFAPQFWGEDGLVFFFQAATQGWASVAQPYAGYLLLGARVIACLAAPLPWEYLPLVYSFSAGLAAALVVTRVAFARLPAPQRVMAALVMIAVPHSGEIFLNLTNLHWFLAALLAINLLEPAPLGRAEAWRRGVEILVGGLSGPLGICLTPFAAVWTWRERRNRQAWILAGMWAVAVLVQVGVLLVDGSRGLSTGIRPLIVSAIPAAPDYAAALFIGPWAKGVPILGYVTLTVAVSAIAWALLERGNVNRSRALLLLIAAAMLLGVGRMATTQWPAPLGYGARYTYFPFVFTLWAVAWLGTGSRQPSSRVAMLVLYAAALLAGMATWQARPLPDSAWPQQVREARAGVRTEFEVAPNWKFPVPPSQNGGEKSSP